MADNPPGRADGHGRDPDLTAMPPVVAALRRRHRRGDAGLDLLTEPDEMNPSIDPPDDPDPGDSDLAEPDLDLSEVDPSAGGDMDQGEDLDDVDGNPDVPVGDGADAVVPGVGPVPVSPALDHPLLQVWPPAGLGLTGPGAEPAARGFLVAALAADGRDEPDARTRVVVPAGTLATLLGADAVQVGDTPRLTVTAGLADALDLLEAATLHRTRLTYDHEVDTVAALREADPMEEPLPPLLLIADTTAVHQRTRVASLLTQGQRLDIHGVLLGEWADGNTVHVAPNGATSRVDAAERSGGRHGAHPADIGRLAVIDPTQTADLLRVLAEAHTGQPQPAPPVEAIPTADPVAEPLDRTTAPRNGATPGAVTDLEAAEADHAPNDEKATSARPGRADPPLAAPVADAAVASEAVTPDPYAPGPHIATTAPRDAADEPATALPEDAATTAGPARARVFVLGPPRVDNLPPLSRTDPLLRPKALELLVYLVVRGGNAPRDDILYDVLPDAPRSKGAGRLNTFVYSLRRSLKTSAGGRTARTWGLRTRVTP